MTTLLQLSRRAFLGAVLATVASLPALAAEPLKLSPEQQTAVNAISDYLNSFKTLQGEFTQISPKGNMSQGIFYIAKPGKMRFEYAPPNPFLIVSDGTTPPPDHPNVYQPTACPGGRPPHAWLADERSLYDALGLGWSLLVLPSEATDMSLDAHITALASAARARGVSLNIVSLADPALRELYEAPLALIRPDHIVAWRGQAAENAQAVVDQVLGWRL